jgi:hypothetical protein
MNNYSIIHLSKNRKEERKRWDELESKDTSFTKKNLLICTMFKDSEKWLNENGIKFIRINLKNSFVF